MIPIRCQKKCGWRVTRLLIRGVALVSLLTFLSFLRLHISPDLLDRRADMHIEHVYMPTDHENMHREHVDKKFVITDSPTSTPSKITPKFILKASEDAIGEFGKAGKLNRDDLSVVDQAAWDAGYERCGYNVFLSDRIALQRRVPSIRPKECANMTYPADLPQATIIVPFYRDALSVLLRCLHSIMDRSPDKLIKEIILVDDFSQDEDLGSPLEQYISHFPKVKLLRNEKREGLVRARMAGVYAATAEVIVIKDAHTEYENGWLEPLLMAVKENNTRIALSFINFINADEFDIKGAWLIANNHYFDFFLNQLLFKLKDEQLQKRKNDAEPITVPGMTGSEFAVNREFFLKLGGHDPGLEGWGGEDFELAFKTWMCGGSIQIIPCSMVSHVFRKAMHRMPHTEHRNYIRVASVWMDEYKELLFERYGTYVDEVDIGNITDRVRIRESLQCRGFDWYLKNVATMVYIPKDLVGKGELYNNETNRCLTTSVGGWRKDEAVGVQWCYGKGGGQYWFMTSLGEIRKDEGCVKHNETMPTHLFYQSCRDGRGSQWQYTKERTLVDTKSSKCLGVSGDGKDAQVTRCSGAANQIWEFRPTRPAQKGQ